MKATILIVDDSTFIVEGLVAILQRTYRAIPSFSGEECLSILRTERPDVIVLDIMMEPMDGWETLSRIKENPATRNIPVLMFTAKKITPEEAETHRAWIGDVLIKPVSPKELITAIEKLLDRDRRNKAIARYLEQAGIPHVTIDAYLTRSANLEVDRSLLATLQKISPHSPEIPAVVLQDRIARGRSALDEILNGTGITVEFLNNLPELPEEGGGALPSTSTPDPAPVPVKPPETRAEPVTNSPAVPPPEAAAGPGPASSAPDFEERFPAPPPEIPVADPVPSPEPVPDVPILPGYFSAPAKPDPAPDPVPADPRTQEPAETEPVTWIPIPSHADPLPRGYSPGVDTLFEPDEAVTAPPLHVAKPAAVRDPAPIPAARPAVPPMYRPAPPLPEPEHRGFFARIVAAIKGIFSRKK